ncbi:MAG: bifunctional oligoribonuclease/PAP phosphatase NrnA [Spirochaetales bacterium]|nr:bifunctional oligoribonuclease/PAP phosphatase NrnA [Spirochaetales bacterium]
MKTTDAAIRFLSDYDRYFVLGHIEPDGDCAGSQLAIVSALQRAGKKAAALQTGPFDRPETLALDAMFERDVPQETNLSAAVIVCDCSTKDRIAPEYHGLLSFPTLIIDHHASGEVFGDIRNVDSTAASTTLLVAELLEAHGSALTEQEAELLFFGLVTDTGYFRHCEKHSQRVFSAAAKLVAAGASPKEAYQRMYGNREFLHRKYLGLLLSRAESFFGGRLVYTFQTLEDEEIAAVGGRSTDELYGLFQTVKNVEVILFVREESADMCSVGLRSKREIDVGAIARQNNGGGHKLASGFYFTGKKEEVKTILLETFAPLFQG